MKKFGLLFAGFIAAMVLMSNLGPLVGLGVSLLVLYFVVKQFLKAHSTAGKIGWGIAGFIILMAAASNVPAILGIAAAYVLYLVYKNWDKKEVAMKEANDPFVNFEKQWAEMKNN
ncbi:flagellar basal body rod protein [Mesobacillus sp. AQ2]|jgi:lia operon protein LiaI|uniref:lmo0954 family membrane protein n=1 Tax=Bacillaceae TaxID=186817 RepID=UPI0011A515B7|nr:MULTISPECIES: flagellar basal body rod protein [Bacillaceae]MCM3125463.1 flagellar basal body rod protein [Mesobacillus sp. MER 33]MCM3234493.1 flagellar basal body rod protein [Mesobacillus sp. MER 48]WHX41464.1 flagellar basal body rod protein [Mesobacillus sp. AQ2]